MIRLPSPSSPSAKVKEPQPTQFFVGSSSRVPRFPSSPSQVSLSNQNSNSPLTPQHSFIPKSGPASSPTPFLHPFNSATPGTDRIRGPASLPPSKIPLKAEAPKEPNHQPPQPAPSDHQPSLLAKFSDKSAKNENKSSKKKASLSILRKARTPTTPLSRPFLEKDGTEKKQSGHFPIVSPLASSTTNQDITTSRSLSQLADRTRAAASQKSSPALSSHEGFVVGQIRKLVTSHPQPQDGSDDPYSHRGGSSGRSILTASKSMDAALSVASPKSLQKPLFLEPNREPSQTNLMAHQDSPDPSSTTTAASRMASKLRAAWSPRQKHSFEASTSQKAATASTSSSSEWQDLPRRRQTSLTIGLSNKKSPLGRRSTEKKINIDQIGHPFGFEKRGEADVDKAMQMLGISPLTTAASPVQPSNPISRASHDLPLTPLRYELFKSDRNRQVSCSGTLQQANNEPKEMMAMQRQRSKSNDLARAPTSSLFQFQKRMRSSVNIDKAPASSGDSSSEKSDAMVDRIQLVSIQEHAPKPTAFEAPSSLSPNVSLAQSLADLHHRSPASAGRISHPSLLEKPLADLASNNFQPASTDGKKLDMFDNALGLATGELDRNVSKRSTLSDCSTIPTCYSETDTSLVSESHGYGDFSRSPSLTNDSTSFEPTCSVSGSLLSPTKSESNKVLMSHGGISRTQVTPKKYSFVHVAPMTATRSATAGAWADESSSGFECEANASSSDHGGVKEAGQWPDIYEISSVEGSDDGHCVETSSEHSMRLSVNSQDTWGFMPAYMDNDGDDNDQVVDSAPFHDRNPKVDNLPTQSQNYRVPQQTDENHEDLDFHVNVHFEADPPEQPNGHNLVQLRWRVVVTPSLTKHLKASNRYASKTVEGVTLVPVSKKCLSPSIPVLANSSLQESTDSATFPSANYIDSLTTPSRQHTASQPKTQYVHDNLSELELQQIQIQVQATAIANRSESNPPHHASKTSPLGPYKEQANQPIQEYAKLSKSSSISQRLGEVGSDSPGFFPRPLLLPQQTELYANDVTLSASSPRDKIAAAQRRWLAVTPSPSRARESLSPTPPLTVRSRQGQGPARSPKSPTSGLGYIGPHRPPHTLSYLSRQTPPPTTSLKRENTESMKSQAAAHPHLDKENILNDVVLSKSGSQKRFVTQINQGKHSEEIDKTPIYHPVKSPSASSGARRTPAELELKRHRLKLLDEVLIASSSLADITS